MPTINNLCLLRPLLLLAFCFAFFSLYNAPQVSAVPLPCKTICPKIRSDYFNCNTNKLCDVPILPNGNFNYVHAFNCCECCPKSDCYMCFDDPDGTASNCINTNQPQAKTFRQISVGNGTMIRGKSAASSVGQTMGQK